MARKRDAGAASKPDMTPMMDVCFQLIIFFTLVMTIAKDEFAQKVALPLAKNPPISEDEQVPDSININVDPEGMLLGWGPPIDMRSPAGVRDFRQLLLVESNLAKEAQPQWRDQGLNTTVIVRVSTDVEFDVFRKIMELCREMGFNKFQLKAQPPEEKGGSS